MEIDLGKYREMNRFSKQTGDLLGETLYGLCKRHPDHTHIGEITAKLWLIGRGFATGVERHVPTTGNQGGSLWKMVLHMKKHRISIDEIVDSLKKIHEPLSIKKLQIILAEHGRFCRIVSRIARRRHSLVSFASKYLHFHAPIVPIFDSWVGRQAWRMREKQSLEWFECPKGADPNYYWYCVCFWQLYSKLRDLTNPANVRQTESYLMWLANDWSA